MTEELLFSEAEWVNARLKVVREMTEFLRPFRTPVYEHCEDHGQGWGSGSYLSLDGTVCILTNEHVAHVRHDGRKLTHQFNGQEDIRLVLGNHVEYPAPLDLALLPVNQEAWSDQSNSSMAITIDQIALAHDPVEGELCTFTGFAGDNVSFHFDSLFAKSTCYTAREYELAESELFSPRFHFGLEYRPDLATQVGDHGGLPLPPGLSGSVVWNTNFVAAKMADQNWKPEMAKVTGIVWGWPSNAPCLIATRAEYLRSFLLGAKDKIKPNA